MFRHFYHFQIAYVAPIDFEAQQCAHLMETIDAGGSGIHGQHLQCVVVLHFQYVRMSADKQVWLVGQNFAIGLRAVTSGIAADVGHEHFDVFALEGEEFGTTPAHHSGVDVATDSAETRADGEQTAIGVFVADVAGVPYLVAVGEMDGEAVIPARMCVGQYAYFKHCFR